MSVTTLNDVTTLGTLTTITYDLAHDSSKNGLIINIIRSSMNIVNQGSPMLKRFFLWMQRDDGWKAVLAAVYAVICVVDFVIMPMTSGAFKAQGVKDFIVNHLREYDPAVQLQILQIISREYLPFTLQGSGVFHLAFGALLTGSALSKPKTEEK